MSKQWRWKICNQVNKPGGEARKRRAREKLSEVEESCREQQCRSDERERTNKEVH